MLKEAEVSVEDVVYVCESTSVRTYPVYTVLHSPNCRGKSHAGFPSPTKMLSAADLRNHLGTDGIVTTENNTTSLHGTVSPVTYLLMKRGDWLESRFGCSATGSISQAEDSPPRAQERRLKLGYVSLLQV